MTNVTPLPPRPDRRPLRDRVAEEVRSHLARRNISVSAAATQLEMSQPYLSRRVNGKVPFDVDDLEKIATWLGVPLAVLLGQDIADAPSPPNGRRGGRVTGSHTRWYPTSSSPSAGSLAQVIAFRRSDRLVSSPALQRRINRPASSATPCG